MSLLRGFAFSIARALVPSSIRKRLNKYRGENPGVRWKLGRTRKPVVLSGPFKGLAYPKYSTGSEYFPKLLGTYEMELHSCLEELKTKPFTQVVIVGAGEGFYVGGLARCFPQVPIVSFEGDAYGQRAIAEMSRANGFSERLKNLGFCHVSDLAQNLQTDGKPLLVMDVEGGEKDLLDFEKVPQLRNTTVLVEIHDCYFAGLDDVIRERFRGTHHYREILAVPRTLDDARTVPVSPAIQEKLLPLIDEKRPGQMRWFLLTPLQDSSGK